MPTVCIQCAMRAILAGEPVPTFDEEPDEHQRRCHPDLDEAARERAELQRQLQALMGARK
jgi:hypothetical protein